MLTMEHPTEETLELLTAYYHHDLEPLLSALSEDCVWISPAERILIGATAIRAEFDCGILFPVFHMEDSNLMELPGTEPGQTVVCGDFMLYSDPGAEMVLAERQRITFCYREEKIGWKLYHMHVSNLWKELAEGEIFPVQLSRQTYLYIDRILKKSGQRAGKRLILKEDGAVRFVDPNLILYVEAAGKASILHMVDSVISVPQSITALEAELPDHFLRAHRSFLVNCRYITRVERFAIVFVTGDQLPIPKLRYAEVRDALTARIAEQGSRKKS